MLGKKWSSRVGDTRVGEGEPKCGGNGKEIWESWKRAWDLWNNHYIEGRVNRLWVGEEWKRREEAQREWDAGRDDRRREVERKKRAAGGGDGGWHGGFGNVLRPEHEIRRPKPALEKTALEVAAHEPPIVIGSESPPGRVGRAQADNILDPANDPPRITTPHHGRIVYVPEDSDEEMPDSTCHSVTIVDEEPDEASDSEPPPPLTTKSDGSSAGWFPIKELPEYYEPDEEEDNVAQWVDNLTNTVWTPRRVGEKSLQVELDRDIEFFRQKRELQVDGGVDCGRSPFPVLRPVTQYTKGLDGAFRKKMAWDGVTGTVFNMPTKPMESCEQREDGKMQRVKDVYEDPWRDPKDEKVFPLDIRRVLKVAPTIEKPRDICDKGEMLIRNSKLYLQNEGRNMSEDDPWWVTDSQKLARDAPPRCHPPKHESASLGENFPLDDQLWKEEAARDLRRDAGYFVTNLHGGTLVVNGMEIKKGDVAGPLPAFAIIESPGGQVSFWWGPGGRHYGAGPHNTGLSAKWEMLRKEPDWEHIAESAGEVWDAKIRDRKEREKTGADEDDDEEWEGYKRTKKAGVCPSLLQLLRYCRLTLFGRR